LLIINYAGVDMNKILYFLILVSVLCGCTMNAKKNIFINERNYDVGRKKDIAIHPLSILEIIPVGVKQDKYILYNDDTGCKWAYYVNKETEIIESWEYVSSPDKCYTGLGWFEPW